MLSSVRCSTTLIPIARICSSRNGSSSSTTSSFLTVFANFATSAFGSGLVQPSLRIRQSGKISFTYWYATALVTMPRPFAFADALTPLAGFTTRLNFERFDSFSIAAVRFCAFRRWFGANAGAGMFRAMSFL